MLRTAIDLKEAIEKVPDMLEPIGTCPLDEYYWRSDNGLYENFEYEPNEEEEQEEQKNEQEDEEKEYHRLSSLNERVNNIAKTLKEKYYQTASIPPSDDQLKIDFNGIVYSGGFDIPSELLKDLFNQATEAPYGDQTKLETVVNKEVRDARDISLDHFTVSDTVIDFITKTWSGEDTDGYRMHPTSVVVKAYKMNLYGKEGHFQLHQDTPDKDMVGTALIALSESDNLHLVKNSNDSYTWKSKPGDCIMFYTDCPHKVEKSYWQKSIRGTIAFKIYHTPTDIQDNEVNTNENLQINRVVEAIGKFEENCKKYGFLLSHGYSLDTKTFKGSDHILVESLNRMGKKYTIIPVIHKWHLFSYHGNYDEDEIKSDVYPLTETHIDYVLGRGPKPEPLVTGYEFYKVIEVGYVWTQENQGYSEHTGNEAQPEEQNSIYISRAVVIQ